jgi:hypothetical protein
VRETEEVKVGSKYCWKKFFPSYLAFTNCRIHPIHFPYLEQKLRGLSWTYKERTKERAACGVGGGGGGGGGGLHFGEERYKSAESQPDSKEERCEGNRRSEGGF